MSRSRAVAARIEHSDMDCRVEDVLEHHIRRAVVLDDISTASSALDIETAPRTIANAIADSDVAHAARRLAANRDSRVAGAEDAIRDRNIFAGNLFNSRLVFVTRLDDYAIVSGADIAVRNAHLPAGIRIDTISIG